MRDITAFFTSEAAQGRIPHAVDVAQQFGVSRTYVHSIRSRLVKRGLLPRTPRGRGDLAPVEQRLRYETDRKVGVLKLRKERAALRAEKLTIAALEKVTRPLVTQISQAGTAIGATISSASAPLEDLRLLTEQITANVTSGAAKPMTLDERRSFLSELARLTRREEIKVQALATLNRLESSIQSTDDLGPAAPKTAAEFDARLRELLAARRDVFQSDFNPEPA